MLKTDREKAEKIGTEIQMLLHPFDVYGRLSILSNLLALLLAGFQGPEAPAVRKELLEAFVDDVKDIIPEQEKFVLEKFRRGEADMLTGNEVLQRSPARN